MDPNQIENETVLPAEERENKRKKKKTVVIVIVCMLGVLLLAGGMFMLSHFVFSPRLDLPEKPSQTKEEVKPSPVIGDDEIRGVYIASVFNINFPSKKGLSAEALAAELDAIVLESRTIGFDTIYFQVRPSADALYDSAIFPTSRYLVGQEGAELPMDPLAYLIEKASEYDMKVIAWVNPYRVTASATETKEEALSTLSENHPARLDPSLTVFYGGKLYFNPALPEVRDLIVRGVDEIVTAYDVAGVLYDDYFYPYPANGEAFDDFSVYEASGSPLSHADWRREQVNLMVKASFDTVKAKDENLTFGVSPIGIWKNVGSDPSGSDTRGLEAYHSLFCDALAWIKGGYVDYISPQLYWERGYEIADFAKLCRWWSAQVDGTGVGLVISHAAYRAGEFRQGGAEIAQQIQYARSFIGSCGSIQYGFADIKKNTAGVKDALTSLYAEVYMDELPTPVEGVSFPYPANGVKTTNSSQFISVRSDPNVPLYQNGVKLGRTKDGFCSVRMPLAMGKNTLTLTQNGVNYTLDVVRTEANTAPSRIKQLAITEITPSKDGVIASSGALLPVRVTAPARAKVCAFLGDASVELTPTIEPKDSSPYAKEIYEGVLVVPAVEGESAASLGPLRFTLSLNGAISEMAGPTVSVLPRDQSMIATVTKDYTYIKKARDSSFYDDYTPASVGMQCKVDAIFDSFCLLSFGAYVAEDAVSISYGDYQSVLTHVSTKSDQKKLSLDLTFGAAPAVDVALDGEHVRATFFDSEAKETGKIKLPEKNLLFSSGTLSAEGGCVVLDLTLRNESIFFGFDLSYANGVVSISFRLPQALPKGEKPLSGKVIVVDAGHGGSDKGALGFSDQDEKDLNLAIALALCEELSVLGADVRMTRTDDTTVSLTERMDFLTKTDPDLAISVHHNSVHESSDANSAAGTLGLYWSHAGLLLAEHVQSAVQKELAIRDQGVRRQMLALCRNHRFPQTLVETSFICNPAEYQMALRSDYAPNCAKAIRDGVLSWYRAQETVLKEGGK